MTAPEKVRLHHAENYPTARILASVWEVRNTPRQWGGGCDGIYGSIPLVKLGCTSKIRSVGVAKWSKPLMHGRLGILYLLARHTDQ